MFNDRIMRMIKNPQAAVLGLAVLSLFLFLGTRGLNEPDEGRFAEVSREMALQSSWLMPHLCGVPHLQKPPMIYWVTATCIRLFGANEWAVRTPSALAALGTLIMTMMLAGLLFGKGTSWKAGLILLTSVLFFLMAHVITTDMLLTFWITAAVTAFVYYVKKGSVAGLILFYLCLGFGFLTKGPMAFFVPYSAAIPFALFRGKYPERLKWRWHWIPGLLVSIGIGFLWFYPLFRQYPALVDYFVKYEFLERIASNTHSRAKPFWFYSLCLIGGFFPWSLFFPRLVAQTWLLRKKALTSTPRLFIGWIVIPWIILHLVVSKLATYILPLFPPFAILFAYLWDRSPTSFRTEVRLFAVSLFLVMASTPYILWHFEQRYQREIPVNGILIGMLLVILTASIVVFWQASRALKTKCFLAMAALMLTAMLMLTQQAKTLMIGRNAGTKLVAEAILKAQATTGIDKVLIYSGRYYSLDFYLQRNVMRRLNSVDLALPMPADLEHRFIADPDAYLSINKNTPILVMVGKARIMEFLYPGSDWRLVFENNGRFVVTRD